MFLDIALATRILFEEQKKLRLLDWDIRIKIGVPAGGGGAIASNEIDSQTMTATITIPPEHNERMKYHELDMPGDNTEKMLRRSIRHELLHIYGFPIRDLILKRIDDEEDKNMFVKYEESWIERVCRALES